MIWLLSTLAMASPWIVPEVTVSTLRPPAHVPRPGSCNILVGACQQGRIVGLHYGASMMFNPGLFAQVRRTDFLGHEAGSNPYAVDVRVGGWTVGSNSYGPDTLYFPENELFVYGGTRYVHHAVGSGGGGAPPLANGLELQVGALYYYSNDGFPDAWSGYFEFAYLRAVKASWSLNESGRRNGFLLRTGIAGLPNAGEGGPLHLGMNVSADPGFGFSMEFEVGLKMGFSAP